MKIRTSSHCLPRDDDGRPSSDAVSITQWDGGFIAALADGAGTAAAAREAAEHAVTMIGTHYRSHPLGWTPGKALRETVRMINRGLWNESLARFARTEMVCTLAVALYDEGILTHLGIGDSRIYLLRAGELQQLTTDDIDPLQTNRLTKALGAGESLSATSFKMSLEAGDTLFLCSDGIHHHLPDDAIYEALASGTSARHLAKQARDASPEETRDDCAAIRIDIDSLEWTARREDHQLPVPEKLAAGQKHDGWSLIRSFGANDRCWLAEREGCRQVMKFAPLEAIDQAAMVEAFLKETWNAIRFSEEAPFVKAWENPARSSLYYNMEFVDAPGLANLLKQRRLQVDETVQLGHFLAGTGIRLLRHDLLHGDIKPENILIGSAYDSVFFKLIDLGSSCEVFSRNSRAGTASYLAPERFKNAPISERTEVFSIGVTLYEAVAGQLPFGQIERFQTPNFRDPKPPGTHNPLVPPWLDAVILRACAIDPEERYSHFSELLFDLANPQKVRPWHPAKAPLIERHPVLFWKCAAIFLAILAVVLAIRLGSASK
ncbi:protein phosphatase 2C domain-containing protein [Luteolibacter sp. GHJ8]|uniref:Protein phosphatase 2C domain-containing protein n=1 Tax=Luteolibacter rhizosphaerae TaxID=2989719 RepID=A0ABT3G6X4_9BACT|nr:bifunctional protein-serine/threonine kinase/phosphatase [Luteolibacter rhizosphaerae]MCW1915309.1 protein phosphatase 2C domain-containing protein [Luteolibacter rhizosphaerae]